MSSSTEEHSFNQDVVFLELCSKHKTETSTIIKMFPEHLTEEDDHVQEVFNCSLLTGGISDMLNQGHMYLTENHLCFVSGLKLTKLVVAFSDVSGISKPRSNAIEINAGEKTYTFSFFSRDLAYDMLITVWNKSNSLLRSKGNWRHSLAVALAAIRHAKDNKTFHEEFITVADFETIIEHYTCTLNNQLTQGKMYITNNYTIYYHWKWLLYSDSLDNLALPFKLKPFEDVKIRIPLKDVVAIQKKQVIPLLPDVIELEMVTQGSEQPAKYFFGSFVTLPLRDQCCILLQDLWNKYKARPQVFGVGLKHLLERENRLKSVPTVVEKMITFLKIKGIKIPGLFKVAARQWEIEKIQYLMDEGQEVDILNISQDPHVMAALLKKWFRDLPSPLFPKDVHSCFKIFHETKDMHEKQDLPQQLNKLVSIMPDRHIRLARYLFDFLALVVENEEKNEMDSRTLASIWTPIIFKSQFQEAEYAHMVHRSNSFQNSNNFDVDKEEDQEVNALTDLVEIMILNHKTIFTAKSQDSKWSLSLSSSNNG